MAKTHGVVNTTHCACWDVDAYNFAGIYKAGDLDNGTFVALGDIMNTDGKIDKYTFAVTPDANGASDMKYIVDSPVRGIDVETQIMDDPRYFYIPAGKTASIKRLVKGDCVELNVNALKEGVTPVDQPTYKSASIGAEGKLQMVQTGGSFKLVGAVDRGYGQEVITHYVFMLMA